jgi:hypothetical protein
MEGKMRKLIMLSATGLILSACASTGDPQAVARDHAACVRNGAESGTDQYRQCMLALQSSRSQQYQQSEINWAGIAAFGAALQGAAQQFPPPPPSTTFNCSSRMVGNAVQTQCHEF